MPKHPPPLRPLAVAIVVDRLRVIVPVAAVAVLVLAVTPGLALLLFQPPLGPQEAPREQRWTAGTGAVASLSLAAVSGALPPADPRQRRPPCLERIGEEAFNGVCWLRLDVRPPCPKDPEAYAWEHNGKCYAYALKAAGLPTSGEGRPLGVAEP